MYFSQHIFFENKKVVIVYGLFEAQALKLSVKELEISDYCGIASIKQSLFFQPNFQVPFLCIECS